ncbi:MAG: hypothetical protein IJD46_03275 [Bacilli bacterium]|nr:hypothetical protein [Bacilli bacterium]
MIQVAYFLLIFVLIIDLLFYVPLKIHFYIDSSSIYLYLFTFKIIYKDDFKDFNLLKDKITINKIKESDKEDIKIIKSFKIKKLHTSIDKKLSLKYCYLLYPLLMVNNDYITINLNKNNQMYILIELKLANLLKEIIKIRRIKHERTSN